VQWKIFFVVGSGNFGHAGLSFECTLLGRLLMNYFFQLNNYLIALLLNLFQIICAATMVGVQRRGLVRYVEHVLCIASLLAHFLFMLTFDLTDIVDLRPYHRNAFPCFVTNENLLH